MKSYQQFCEQQTQQLFELIDRHGSLLQWRQQWSVTGNASLPIGSNGLYKGGNLFNLIFEQIEKGFSSAQWLTFNQVKRCGETVNKGAKSSVVYFWSFREKIENEEATGGEVKKSIPIFKTYRVFNRDQTSLAHTQNETEIFHKNAKIYDLLDGNTVTLYHCGNKAYYNPLSDTINLPKASDFHSEASYFATLLHELVHATGHKTRLARESLKRYQDKTYRAEEELIAEIGAFLLCTYFNIDGLLENHAAYIKDWKTLLTPKEVMRATHQAGKAFHYLLEVMDTQVILNKAA